jgi:phosphatidate cytidylyltransferase
LQAYLVLQTLEYGMAWYIFAMSIITLNDIAAYMCGFFFGSRPLILLSPKKTLEGYIGENICFMVFLFIISSDGYRDVPLCLSSERIETKFFFHLRKN